MLLRLFGRALDRVLGVALALAAAQFPLYYAQYTDALTGAYAEALTRYTELERAAADVNLSVDAFIAHHESDSDPAFRASGEIHRTTMNRYRRLSVELQEFREARPWEKPLVLAREFDPQIAQALQFQPGLPLTAEALVYALIGLAATALLAAIVRLMFGVRRPRYA